MAHDQWRAAAPLRSVVSRRAKPERLIFQKVRSPRPNRAVSANNMDATRRNRPRAEMRSDSHLINTHRYQQVNVGSALLYRA